MHACMHLGVASLGIIKSSSAGGSQWLWCLPLFLSLLFLYLFFSVFLFVFNSHYILTCCRRFRYCFCCCFCCCCCRFWQRLTVQTQRRWRSCGGELRMRHFNEEVLRDGSALPAVSPKSPPPLQQICKHGGGEADEKEKRKYHRLYIDIYIMLGS